MRFTSFPLLTFSLSFEAKKSPDLSGWKPKLLVPDPAHPLNWKHSVPAGWPGDSTTLRMSTLPSGNVSVHFEAIPCNAAIGEAIEACRIAAVPGVTEASLWLNGDGYGATHGGPMPEEIFRELVSGGAVLEMDAGFDKPWNHSVEYFDFTKRADGTIVLKRTSWV